MMDEEKRAAVWRMVMPEHVCPYGRKSVWLLKRRGYRVEDHWLETREQTDAFKAEHGVKTTPQTFIHGQRIGGWDNLRRHFGWRVRPEGETTYAPVLAVFAAMALTAIAVGWSAGFGVERTAMLFVSLTMVALAMLKLQDVERFSSMFLNYDLLAQRWVPYAYLYPFLELTAGVLMTAMALTWLAAPLGLVIGGVGAVSVFKAVYVDRRELKCACVGGGSNVPLGFVSLSESLAMVGMGIWMLIPQAG